jgi:FlgD Ig-like domain
VRRHAATILVLSILLGTAVAFAETERLKLQPTPIQESFVQPAFSPVCTCALTHAAIRFRLHRANTVNVRITDGSGHTVRLLVDSKRLPRGRTQFEWNGRDDAGQRLPDGRYWVEVHLRHGDRTFKLPRPTVLDTVAPTVRLVSLRPRALSRGERVRVVYRVSEPAHGVLFVNGRQVIVTYTKSRTARLQWRPRRARRYRLQLAAVDLAGNLGPRSPVFIVRVRAAA